MKVAFLFITFFFFSYISAQVALRGKVVDENHQPLSSASVTLSYKNSNTILAYSITDKNGIYQLSWKSGADSLKISVHALNFATKELIIESASSVINFTLTPQPLVLKEVKIKQPPVWQRKDTINYSVSEFKQPQD
ncbi:MAG TPA: carboxypeptidase-like regulatory domain-containing protein, partial [Patescibacteria group bacterium]|nr:carboxypeptidase-like regulatory domain-containing protein [Patescibacteria group bacterium]